MLSDLSDTLGKICVLGLTYFDAQGEELKRSLIGGRVVSADIEKGIVLALLGEEASGAEDSPLFTIPSNLSCWFNAPSGQFHTSRDGVRVDNPDFLVTWDIYQTRKGKGDGEQQWWEWFPRNTQPNVDS